jgi:adenine-specific DNA methylase
MLEKTFDPVFATALALKEKQIQQNYRPLIGIHKWFARRPGTVFRNLLLAEFNGSEPLRESFWHAHDLRGVIADPFMGGGTTVFEANRLGLDVVATDINPMAFWIVRQAIAPLDLHQFQAQALNVATDVENVIGDYYRTTCVKCGALAHVKYFLWVKTAACPDCGTQNDLFPGHLVAEAERHPKNVLVCAHCGALNECDKVPRYPNAARCHRCGGKVQVDSSLHGQYIGCRGCSTRFRFVTGQHSGRPPSHRMFAVEYHCEHCKPLHIGRLFKEPDKADLDRYASAARKLERCVAGLPIPDAEIPNGDETARLHRWGYRRYREMFNERQLLGLGILLQTIERTADSPERNALLTVFSDILRYQNMLCRYDTYALKCQDIFSVHGFPVGLVQCENNLIGIPRVGSGAFRHFVAKYVRAKSYCDAPFETRTDGRTKQIVSIPGERIKAELVDSFPTSEGGRRAWLAAVSATDRTIPANSLDGVFTDPPYYDNVQYAELIDFCYVWLRQALSRSVPEFEPQSTRSLSELTANETEARGLEHFSEGLSAVYRHFAAGLKHNAPFVFTYHHNDPLAYVPIVISLLDAELVCTAVLPVAAEMGASMHIAGTGSSVLDSVFVCRRRKHTRDVETDFEFAASVRSDVAAVAAAGVKIREGDVRCLLAGHMARAAVNQLSSDWIVSRALPLRLDAVQRKLRDIATTIEVEKLVSRLWKTLSGSTKESLVATPS